MPMLMLSAIITLTILEYIRKSLKIKFSTQLYQELLDKPNNIDMVGEITKAKYVNLIFLVSDSSKANTISKTMIFVNDIEDI